MLENAAAALNTPDLGRRLATRQGIEILGPVGLAGRNAATVGEAFAIFDKFMAAYSPSIRAHVVAHDDPRFHRFEFEYLLAPAPRMQALELSLGVVLKLLRSFLGRRYRPVAVHIPHLPLTPADTYATYFGCPPKFAESVAGFTLRPSDMLSRLPADALAHQTAVEYLAAMVTEDRSSMRSTVSTLVRQLMPSGVIGLDDLAGHLELHPRALQRLLAAENTSFSTVVDEARREAARRLLATTDMDLGHLCHELGYSEQSVLTRSCRRWFGMTPSEFRDETRGPRAT
ncbi:putative AraC family transcriptional regulator [Gordonia araii NBRC 100433]|uniref:Putative AraC family transcriptional regulator n=2 Tax=Gordonia araii TaxID=263909 RepID=G7GY57_9ACTN|nr:putative AraC family transcriptional regulator [Gordonia araii NBRC 100433]